MNARNDQRHRLQINRAPVLTLWAAVVAERLGFDWEEALTLGRALTGLNAYSKGASLGLFQPTPQEVQAKRRAMRKEEALTVDLLHRAVPAIQTPEGLRALSKNKPINPESVQRYLQSKFGDALDDACDAMMVLAKSMRSSELAQQGYEIYVTFRPKIPAGTKGWGAKGRLDLDAIRSMSDQLRTDFYGPALYRGHAAVAFRMSANHLTLDLAGSIPEWPFLA
jgi:hypothetical protein